jgi:hypothetical protein
MPSLFIPSEEKQMIKPVLDLRNVSGNAFSILGATSRRLKDLNVPEDERKAFLNGAMSGSYYDLLNTISERFHILTSEDGEDL